MCSAYQSFMNLDLTIPVSKWGEPAVEILWEAPREPVCKSQGDCRDLLNSVCSNDSTNLGQKRCFCKKGFQWDSVNAVCEGPVRFCDMVFDYLRFESFTKSKIVICLFS